MDIKAEDLFKMYRLMLLSRRFDEKTLELVKQGRALEAPHTCIGHEATSAGAFYGCREDDLFQAHFRSRPAWLLRTSPKALMANFLGKRTAPAKGKTGYLHTMFDGWIERTGLVGSGIPIAVGAALAAKLRKTGQVVVCSFGDGASNRGDFHEGLNFAAIWKLPVVFVCENNQISVSTPISESTAIADISGRAASYGFPGVSVDGMDVIAVHEAAQQAIKRAREGKGPTLIECKCYRLGPHCGVTPDSRPQDEVNKCWERDSLKIFETTLIKRRILTGEKISNMDKEIHEEIEEAVKFAEESPFPDPGEVVEDVYAPATCINEPDRCKGNTKTYGEAIIEAIMEEMRRDKSVFMIGEEVTTGTFLDLKGLAKEFGKERVRDTPISESGIVGLAVGAAMNGMRPIVELMFADYLTIAMDQIVNSAAKMRYAYAGKAAVPLVIRTPYGCATGTDMYHSQSLEAWFTHVPGLKVVCPSTPYDAKGLMKSAILEDNPVIFFEHKLLYSISGVVPEEEYAIPLGVASIKRAGKDITIIATSLTVHRALAAAERLEKDGISTEVIDPRTLLPLDKGTIIKSVKKTGRVLIVHEACKTGGVGGEIAAIIAEEALDYLEAPITRLGALFVPPPFSPPLKESWLSPTSEEAIIKAAKEKF